MVDEIEFLCSVTMISPFFFFSILCVPISAGHEGRIAVRYTRYGGDFELRRLTASVGKRRVCFFKRKGWHVFKKCALCFLYLHTMSSSQRAFFGSNFFVSCLTSCHARYEVRAAANACLDVIVECDRVTPNDARSAEDTKSNGNDESKSNNGNSSEGAQQQSGGLGRLGLEVCRRRFRAHNKEWLASAAKDDYSYGRGAYGGASAMPNGAADNLAYAALHFFVHLFRVCYLMYNHENKCPFGEACNRFLIDAISCGARIRRRLAQRLLARLPRSSPVVKSGAWRDGVRFA